MAFGTTVQSRPSLLYGETLETKGKLILKGVFGTQVLHSSVKTTNQSILPQLYISLSDCFFTKETVTMTYLKKNLGETISVKELAEYLNINEKTVREHYLDFNGIKVGNRYRFFEREVINAIQKSQKQIYSSGQEERSATGESLSDAEGGESVGSQDEKAVRRRVERQDKHGLLVD
jgi:hypothetical protein